MFEIEMTSQAMKKNLLEPSLVAIMIIRPETRAGRIYEDT
jgi:hypothetical protein